MFLRAWLRTAPRGARVVYFVGYLPLAGRQNSAKVAWQAYQDGLVNLVQRKVANFTYEYIAQRR